MIAATSNMHEAGIRKAAILVASLDQAAADRLLDQLPPECADRVRQAVMTIDQIDVDERQRVIDEFRRIGPMIPDPCPPGIDLDGPPALVVQRPENSYQREKPPHCNEGALGSGTDFSEETLGQTEMPAPPPPFEFLRDAEEEKLSQLLGGERPQTIALVLSHLPPERAGEVLARFAPPQQVEVVRRLVDLEHTDPETLREVEQALEARLSRQFTIGRGRAAGPDAVARILAACPSGVVGGILDNLAEYDHALAEQLGRRSIAFDDLGQLDDATLLAVFRTAEPEVVQAALLGAEPPLVERILRRMTSEEAKRLRRKLNCPGPIRLSDVEDARQQIAALAQQMWHSDPLRTAFAA